MPLLLPGIRSSQAAAPRPAVGAEIALLPPPLLLPGLATAKLPLHCSVLLAQKSGGIHALPSPPDTLPVDDVVVSDGYYWMDPLTSSIALSIESTVYSSGGMDSSVIYIPP